MAGKPKKTDDYVAEKLIARALRARDEGRAACLERDRGLNQDGYLRVTFGSGKTKFFLHRVVYERAVGPIPAGLCVLHRCDNRRCFNPLHFFTGSHQDNMDDMNQKGRGNYFHGEDHPSSKLNDEKVQEIRRLRTQGYTQQEIADQFGVQQATISRIILRKTWKHVV